MNEVLRHSTRRDLLLWLLRLRQRRSVAGASMLSTLRPGDEVLVDVRAYRRIRPALGDIVIARHPRRPDFSVIKRVTALLEPERYFLQGDNADESSDSRDFGAITRQEIIGRVTCRFP